MGHAAKPTFLLHDAGRAGDGSARVERIHVRPTQSGLFTEK